MRDPSEEAIVPIIPQNRTFCPTDRRVDYIVYFEHNVWRESAMAYWTYTVKNNW